MILVLFVALSWYPPTSKVSTSQVTLVKVFDAKLCPTLLVNLTPAKVEPPAGAAHFKPVASALSATILQEQSQRIVLSLIAGVLHPRLYLGGLVGLGVGLLW